jgi:hypothetical protein
MAVQIYRFDEGANQLVESQPGYPVREFAANFGPSLTITRGQAVGLKTSDHKMYALNTAASDGTQTFAGFSKYSLTTDSNGIAYLNIAGGSADYFTAGYPTSPIYTGGIFNPNLLYTQPLTATTAVAEVDTITPAGSVTTGDLYSVYNAAGVGVTITVGATQTATGAVTLLKAAWNANPDALAIATPSGTATFILTGVTPGKTLGLTATAVGTGIVSLAITTAATTGVVAEVDTFTPTNPTTGDVYTITVTQPSLATTAVSFTVGATQTATATVTGLKAAWNANPSLVAYATASGTATLIFTGANVGQTLSIAGSVVGTGTIPKVVTTPAFGRNIADILPGNPGAHVLQPTGFWAVP